MLIFFPVSCLLLPCAPPMPPQLAAQLERECELEGLALPQEIRSYLQEELDGAVINGHPPGTTVESNLTEEELTVL